MAVLLVDELVEKTLVDDEAAATVEIQRAGAGLRIGVRDATARIPAQRRASTHDPGTVTELGPKIVWFEIHTVRG